MTFLSFLFLVFVVIVATAYFLTPKRFRWTVLLVASYLFYWINSEWLLFAMLASTAATYLIGLWIQKVIDDNRQYLKDHADEISKEEKKARREKVRKKTRLILLLGVILVLGALLFLKYYNFFASNLNGIISLFGGGKPLPWLSLLLPLGISFYTLQAIAYMTDVYRGKQTADRHVGRFMLFMSFFPQIVQGPIPRYSQLASQLFEGHAFDYRRMCFGAQLILWGWMKKMIIADRLSIPVTLLFDTGSESTGPLVFLAAAMYGLQVYADFSGGMDIARGVAQIFGIELELNFRQPYFATSIEDFWRRWHITLGGWMRDYIFYPLSLSKPFAALSRKTRKFLGQFIGKRLPSFLAMFVVYFLVGFWHGAEWKYVVYGVWNGIFIMMGILLADVYAKARKATKVDGKTSFTVFQMIRTFIIRSLGLVFARAIGVRHALAMFGAMAVKWWDLSFLTEGKLTELGLDAANWILIVIAIIILFIVDFVHEKGVSIREKIAAQPLLFRWVVYFAAIIAVLIFGIYGPSYDSTAFIYEQF